MKGLGLSLILLLIGQVFAMEEKTICGQDDRTPSFNQKIGRVRKAGASSGCTVTLIGKSCVISAGHCKSTFQIAEFNTPPSRRGQIQSSAAKDIYRVDKRSIVLVDRGQGNDYAVFRLKKNSQTGFYPGEVQGNYEVGFYLPQKGEMVRITGYGADRSDPTRNFAQQTHAGPVRRIDRRRSRMLHRADTMGGNSGSSVISERTGKIVGIHTHGGCTRSSSSANASTLISANTGAVRAIKACLAWEEANL